MRRRSPPPRRASSDRAANLTSATCSEGGLEEAAARGQGTFSLLRGHLLRGPDQEPVGHGKPRVFFHAGRHARSLPLTEDLGQWKVVRDDEAPEYGGEGVLRAISCRSRVCSLGLSRRTERQLCRPIPCFLGAAGNLAGRLGRQVARPGGTSRRSRTGGGGSTRAARGRKLKGAETPRVQRVQLRMSCKRFCKGEL